MASPLPEGFTILPPATGTASSCEPILRSAPEWFGIEASIVEYVETIDRLPTVLAMRSEEAVGFMTIEQHFPQSSELHVLCVRPEWHRQGIGAALLAASEAYLRGLGTRFLQVKTLSPRRACTAYERTRRWYEAMGFTPLTEFPTLWDAENPCLQLIKVLD